MHTTAKHPEVTRTFWKKLSSVFRYYNVPCMYVKYFILVSTHVLFWVLIHSNFAAC